jgi:hypothetical protein
MRDEVKPLPEARLRNNTCPNFLFNCYRIPAYKDNKTYAIPFRTRGLSPLLRGDRLTLRSICVSLGQDQSRLYKTGFCPR